MPRKARSYKRHLAEADHKYNSVKIGKFINYIMERGKKTVAMKIVYDAFNKIEADMKTDPKAVFEQAIRNVTPIVEVKGRRIGGANYQVPMEVQEPRKTALGMKWLIDAAPSKKREDVHKMAEANKAFAHFARFQRR